MFRESISCNKFKNAPKFIRRMRRRTHTYNIQLAATRLENNISCCVGCVSIFTANAKKLYTLQIFSTCSQYRNIAVVEIIVWRICEHVLIPVKQRLKFVAEANKSGEMI